MVSSCARLSGNFHRPANSNTEMVRCPDGSRRIGVFLPPFKAKRFRPVSMIPPTSSMYEMGKRKGVSKLPASATSVTRNKPLVLAMPTGTSKTPLMVAEPPMPAQVAVVPGASIGCNPC